MTLLPWRQACFQLPKLKKPDHRWSGFFMGARGKCPAIYWPNGAGRPLPLPLFWQ